MIAHNLVSYRRRLKLHTSPIYLAYFICGLLSTVKPEGIHVGAPPIAIAAASSNNNNTNEILHLDVIEFQHKYNDEIEIFKLCAPVGRRHEWTSSSPEPSGCLVPELLH